MNNFKRRDRDFGGDRNRGRGFGDGGGRREGRPEMHQTICSDCGKSCEVPFRPSGDKPVFCSDCFQKQGGSAPRGRDSRSFGDRNDRPRFNDKPSYRNNSSANTENYKAQFDQLNLKLDNILKVVSSLKSNISEGAKQEKKVAFAKPNISQEVKELKISAKKVAALRPATKKVVKKTTASKKKK